jgi:hypothetical protein
MRHEDDLGRELRSNRPAPTDDYVASIVDSVGKPRRSGISPRLAVGVALSLVAMLALAATGGLTQAMASPSSVAKIVTKGLQSEKKSSFTTVTKSAATDQYDEQQCNSGRGNGSEGDDSQLTDPHAGETGPGETPTVDCDPGNSGDQNHGGD